MTAATPSPGVPPAGQFPPGRSSPRQASTGPLAPPRAPRHEHVLTRADGSRVEDPWYWLRERDDPAVRAHLEAENAYTDAVLADLEDLQERVFGEITSRAALDDASAPVLVPPRAGQDAGWLYYRRILDGQQYPIHCRRPAPAGARDAGDLPEHLRRPVEPTAPPADEVVLLDENAEAADRAYFRLGGLAVSPDQHLAAEAVDTDGSEVLRIRIRDLATGKLLDDEIPRAGYGLAWHADSSALLYVVPDDAWRPHQVWRHRIGTDHRDDELVLDEPDEHFWLGIGRTRSEAFLVIQASSKTTSECHLVDAADASARPRLVAAREPGVEYEVDHRGELLYVVTNADGARDFKLCVAPVDAPGRGSWRDLVAHRDGVRLEHAELFAGHLVLAERTGARTQLRVCDPDTGEGEVLAMPEEVYTAAIGPNPAFDTRTLRYVYTSLTTPTEVVDLHLAGDLASGERVVVKRQEVPCGYDRARFVSWREEATAPDGTRVPISLVRRADVPLDGGAPCLLYGYGAYELSIDPAFSASRLSLLERGVVFAIAHVRGGGELGRRWYEQGRLEHKRNTFTDFVACADHLVEVGVAARDRLAIRGGSAGGLLIGAVLAMRPDVCAAAVAEVPFVDIVTTMSDASLPLTVTEYDEWGDPADPAALAVMAAYSPYDNVPAARLPALLVTAGLNDPRVQYWEPAKWVAKLRERSTGGGPVLLRTEMEAGHGGRSGRYEAWRDEAEVLAFVLAHVRAGGDDHPGNVRAGDDDPSDGVGAAESG